MTATATATLQRLKRVGKAAKNKPARVEADGEPLPVQFNPSTLKIARSNNVDRGGVTAKTQKVQNPSAEPSKLTFDLEFDTAEQSRGGQAVDVREWTALVRQFVEPPTDKQHAGQPAPAVQFAWGTLIFNGVVEQINEELDYFAPDGTPLHAKVSLSLSEQNFAYEALAGPAANNDTKATQPGGAPPPTAPGTTPPGTRPGASGTQNPTQVVSALDGESAQQMLARLGMDPAGWRAAMTGLDSPLGLVAGAPVTLGAEIEAGVPDVGFASFTSAGTADDPRELAAALGIDAADRQRTDVDDAGFRLAASGGIAAATARVQRASGETAAAASRGSFAVPPLPAAASRGSDRAPADRSAPLVDARSTTFGRGVPLQSRGRPETLADAATGGQSAISARSRRVDLPPGGSSTPPWVNPPVDTEASDPRRRGSDGARTRLRREPGGCCR